MIGDCSRICLLGGIVLTATLDVACNPSSNHLPVAQPLSPNGIHFVISGMTELGPMAGWLPPVQGTVEYAEGRGRLDVTKNAPRLLLRAQGIEIASSVAQPGDYYLFDSAGFVHVRPQSKSFAEFSYVVASYNYQDNREGWPQWFSGVPIHPDTVGTARRHNTTEARRLEAYWHMEFYKNREPGSDIRIIAAGRTTVDGIQLGELNVVRWFNPAEALAKLPNGVDAQSLDSLGLTTVAVLGPSSVGPGAFNYTLLHSISGLKSSAVDLSRLLLPRDFTEERHVSAESAASIDSLAVDHGAKWRRIPGHGD